ncbi:MAG: rhomboid family intramembrane serine protease [Pseudomonadota bacterium]
MIQGRVPRSVTWFVVICVVLELTVLASELAGFGPRLRNQFVIWGGFWPELLGQGKPVFPGQAVTMFATVPLLHGGPMHLIMNMLGLLWLGSLVVRRVGQLTFWIIVAFSALGSGLAYAGLSSGHIPMVGASGVIFGLIGALVIWAVRDRRALHLSLMPILRAALVFIILNVVVMLVAGGIVAWQAHLGGFLAGALVGAKTWRDPRRLRF